MRKFIVVLFGVAALWSCQTQEDRGGGTSSLSPSPTEANACEWAFDGECDHPGIGTGVCAANTDTHDCARLSIADGHQYRALARDRRNCTASWALSDDHATPAAAHAAALEGCRSNGGNCELGLTISRGNCLAFATSDDVCSWGSRSSLEAIRQVVLSDCRRESGYPETCRIVTAACSGG